MDVGDERDGASGIPTSESEGATSSDSDTGSGEVATEESEGTECPKMFPGPETTVLGKGMPRHLEE